MGYCIGGRDVAGHGHWQVFRGVLCGVGRHGRAGHCFGKCGGQGVGVGWGGWVLVGGRSVTLVDIAGVAVVLAGVSWRGRWVGGRGRAGRGHWQVLQGRQREKRNLQKKKL